MDILRRLLLEEEMSSPTRKAKRKRRAKTASQGKRRKQAIRREERAKIEEVGRKLGILDEDMDKRR